MIISALAIWQHYSQKENAIFSKCCFCCFCLRVTDMSYRNVSGTSNNCQALSVLIFNCSARVLKRMRKANRCNESNLKTHFCELGCRRKHWRKIDVGISQLSLRLLLHKIRNAIYRCKNSVFGTSPFVMSHESNIIRRPCRTHFMQAGRCINHAPRCENA